MEIARFEVGNGAVRWKESPPGLERWVGAGAIEEIQLRGALLGGKLSAKIVSATATTESHEKLGATSARLAGSIEADISQVLAVQTLELYLSGGSMEAVSLWPDATEWAGAVGVQGLEASLLVEGDSVRCPPGERNGRSRRN